MVKLLFLFMLVITSFSSEIIVLENDDEYSVIPNIQIYNSLESVDINFISKNSTNWTKSNDNQLNFGY